MRKLWLVRHGAVTGDGAHRYLGRTDLPMSTEGEAQIRALRDLLRPERFDLVLASDLARSRRTAEILAEGRDVAVRVVPALREIDMGDWEGRLRAEVARDEPEAWAARGADIVGFRPPAGESFADLAARVGPVLDGLETAPERDVLVAGHAGVNRVLLCRLLGLPLDALFRIAQGHGSVSRVEWHGAGPVVHLLGAEPLRPHRGPPSQ